jgi:hypothetical protein
MFEWLLPRGPVVCGDLGVTTQRGPATKPPLGGEAADSNLQNEAGISRAVLIFELFSPFFEQNAAIVQCHCAHI